MHRAMSYTYSQLRQFANCQSTEMAFRSLTELVNQALTNCERYTRRQGHNHNAYGIANQLAKRVPVRVVTLPNGATVYVINTKKFHKALTAISPRFRTSCWTRKPVYWSMGQVTTKDTLIRGLVELRAPAMNITAPPGDQFAHPTAGPDVLFEDSDSLFLDFHEFD